MHREVKRQRFDARLFTRVRKHYGTEMIMNLIYVDTVVTLAIIVALVIW